MYGPKNLFIYLLQCCGYEIFKLLFLFIYFSYLVMIIIALTIETSIN
jgi:hypothetical protein